MAKNVSLHHFVLGVLSQQHACLCLFASEFSLPVPVTVQVVLSHVSCFILQSRLDFLLFLIMFLMSIVCVLLSSLALFESIALLTVILIQVQVYFSFMAFGEVFHSRQFWLLFIFEKPASGSSPWRDTRCRIILFNEHAAAGGPVSYWYNRNKHDRQNLLEINHISTKLLSRVLEFCWK